MGERTVGIWDASYMYHRVERNVKSEKAQSILETSSIRELSIRL